MVVEKESMWQYVDGKNGILGGWKVCDYVVVSAKWIESMWMSMWWYVDVYMDEK